MRRKLNLITHDAPLLRARESSVIMKLEKAILLTTVYSFVYPFGLCVLFSQCRSCDNFPENYLFQILSYSRAYIRRIIHEKKRG